MALAMLVLLMLMRLSHQNQVCNVKSVCEGSEGDARMGPVKMHQARASPHSTCHRLVFIEQQKMQDPLIFYTFQGKPNVSGLSTYLSFTPVRNPFRMVRNPVVRCQTQTCQQTFIFGHPPFDQTKNKSQHRHFPIYDPQTFGHIIAKTCQSLSQALFTAVRRC